MTATKTYRVDGLVAGLAIKSPCRAVSNENLTLSGEQTVNGVSVIEGNRVFVKDQDDAVENGIYEVETGAWTRSGDFDGNRDLVNGTIIMLEYDLGQLVQYQVTSANPVVIGTSEITFQIVDRPNITYPITMAEGDGGLVEADIDDSYFPGEGDRYKIVDDNSTDNATFLQNAIDSDELVELPIIRTGLLLESAITLAYNRGIRGKAKRLETASIRLPVTYPTSANVIEVADGSTVEDLNVRGITDERRGVVYALNGDVKWTRLHGVSASHVNTGIWYGNGAYYNAIDDPVVHNATVGLHLTGSASGSLNVRGGHFKFCDDAILATQGNQISFYGTTFEFNKREVNNSGGELSFIGCYMTDGANTVLTTSGGTTVWDGLNTQSIKGAGASSTYDSPPANSVATYGVIASGGRTVLKNCDMESNIHANVGFTDASFDNGADVQVAGGTLECHDVRCKDYVPVSYSSGPFIEGTPIKSYVMNGTLTDVGRLPHDIQLAGGQISMAAHGSKKNIWGGAIQTFSGTGDGSSQTMRMRFHVPATYAGRVVYIGWVHGQSTGEVDNPTLQTTDIDFTAFGSFGNTTPATRSAGVWPIGADDVYEDHPRVHWIPCTLSTTEGYIEFQVTNGTGAYTYQFYGMFLVSTNDYQKLAPIINAATRRYAAAAPTAGTWEVGDVVYDETPSAGGTMGWVCTSAGTPGTWKAFGDIAA